MVLLLLVIAPLAFLVARWSWWYQHRLLHLTAAGVARVAGRPGVATDVQLTSVLVDESRVLIGFRPAGTANRTPGRSERAVSPRPRRHHQSLLLHLDVDAPATIARLRRWEAATVPVVLWRDCNGSRVELSQTRTGLQVNLSVIPPPVAAAAAVR